MYRVWEKGQRVLLEVFSDTSLQEISSTRMGGAFPHTPTAHVAAAAHK